MNFLHPGLAFAALASIALPIAIHLLFRRRRVPINWAAMELLREAIRRTNQRLRLEQWLLLALRCVCVLAAGLAIAVPISDRSLFDGQVARTWVVIVDNGATSALMVGAETELDRLRDDVRQTLAARGPNDAVCIITAAVPAQLVLASTTDSVQIEQELARIESAQTPTDLATALELARGSVVSDTQESGGVEDTTSSRQVLVASGFRRASLPVGVEGLGGKGVLNSAVDAASGVAQEGTTSANPSDQRIEYLAVAPSREAPTDVRIVRVEARPTPTADALSVRVSLAREGSNLLASQTRVRAIGDGFVSSPTRTTQWEAGQSEASIEFQLIMPTGATAVDSQRRGVRVVLDDDVLAPGNTYFSVVDVRREIEVGIIGRRGSFDEADIERIPSALWVSRALSPGTGSGMRVRDIDPSTCDTRTLLSLDAVVLARADLLSQSAIDALTAFVRSGAVAIVLPTGDSLAQSWGSTVLPRMGVTVRIDAEARVAVDALRLSEEQPSSSLLASLRPELASLTAPVEMTRVVTMSGMSAGDVILTLTDGTPFIVAQSPTTDEGTPSRGLLVVFASAPELMWSNLPVKPFMVPLFQEIIRAGLQLAAGRNETAVGERLCATANTVFRNDEGAALTTRADGVSESVALVPSAWRGGAQEVVITNITESSLAITPSPIDAVRRAFESLGGVRVAEATEGEQREETRAGHKWSAALFALALTVLLAESLLSRLFSHASVVRAGRTDHGITTVGRVRGRQNVRSRDERVHAGGPA